eukprot:8502339-Lingulodinium_polyedra.AAC.1
MDGSLPGRPPGPGTAEQADAPPARNRGRKRGSLSIGNIARESLEQDCGAIVAAAPVAPVAIGPTRDKRGRYSTGGASAALEEENNELPAFRALASFDADLT